MYAIRSYYDLDHRFDAGDQLIDGCELPQDLSDSRSRPKPTSGDHPKTDCSVFPFRSEQTDIVNRREGAVVLASGKGDFELPGQTP